MSATTPGQAGNPLVLLRCRLAAADGLVDAARALCRESATPLQLRTVAWAADGGLTYVYASIASAWPDPEILAARWCALLPAALDVDVSRLEPLQHLPGHGASPHPTHHYVVETDADEGWDAEIDRWYREEHLPGLAGVPGCLLARRFANADHAPRSHACYELTDETVLGSPPWLQVRGTEWSSRVRPHFRNTRRTMMRLLYKASGND